MPHFTIITTAQATIRETWLVEAENAEAAEEKLFGPEGGIFIRDETLGNEDDREVQECIADDGQQANEDLEAERAKRESPAMAEALRQSTIALTEALPRLGGKAAAAVQVQLAANRAILARIGEG